MTSVPRAQIAAALNGLAALVAEPEPPLMTPKQVAALLVVSLSEVSRMAGRDLPAVRLGRTLRFRREDVEKLIKDRTVRPRLLVRGAAR